MAKTAAAGHERGLQHRRIIERPRLLALLDDSTARVKTLVAPAGYGKTTLAEQWISRDGNRGAWFTARRSSADVAALALGIARAATELVPGCDDRLREHLRSSRASSESVEVFAEILAEELSSWPSDGWLVLDDYQEIAAAPEAERFVGAVVAASPVQLLIASRQRPAWVTARRILYGEVLELNQTELAMDGHEAAEVLVDRTTPSASGLVALANGWPAVIGLAGVSRAEVERNGEVPESLYRFFAEEVFGAFSEEVQAGLSTLAVAPVLDRELAVELLGAEEAETVCGAALQVGVLVEREARLDLHPLARSFLEERRVHWGHEPGPEVVPRCVQHYRGRGDFDAAFEVIARHDRTDQLESLALAGLDELLETGRFSTIETWCERARSAGVETPVFSLGPGGVRAPPWPLRRGGNLRRVRVLRAVRVCGASSFRRGTCRALGLPRGGRARLLSPRRGGCVDGRRSSKRALGPADVLDRAGLSGRLPTLERLTAGVSASDPREAIRAAGHRLFYSVKSGRIDLTEADSAARLLPLVGDAIVESGFLASTRTRSCSVLATSTPASAPRSCRSWLTGIDSTSRRRTDGSERRKPGPAYAIGRKRMSTCASRARWHVPAETNMPSRPGSRSECACSPSEGSTSRRSRSRYPSSALRCLRLASRYSVR